MGTAVKQHAPAADGEFEAVRSNFATAAEHG